MPQAPVRLLCVVIVGLTMAQCGGGGSVGSPCETQDECSDNLQCVAGHCAPRCVRGPDCGDGYACIGGRCQAGVGGAGDACTSDGACTPGLACALDLASYAGVCGPEFGQQPFASPCSAASQCRAGTCALGRCVDLCSSDLDCVRNFICSTLPEADVASTRSFSGCLPERGTLSVDLPSEEASSILAVAIPARAQGFTLTAQTRSGLVGFTSIVDPAGRSLFRTDALPGENRIRHQPAELGATALIPGSSDTTPTVGVYEVAVQSFAATGGLGTERPRTRVDIKLGNEQRLPIRFYMLDLSEHDCLAEANADALLASTNFNEAFAPALRAMVANFGLVTTTFSVTDIVNHPELDALEADHLLELTALGASAPGVNVYLVRHLSPGGQPLLIAGTPGDPMGISARSGIVVGMDALCYQSWTDLARLVSYGIARHLGMVPTVDLAGNFDPLADTDGSELLLLYGSALGGNEVSGGQRDVMRRNPGLQ